GGSVGLKCGANREEADELIKTHPDDVSVMAYIGRSGWNSVRYDGNVADDEVRELVDASYDAVVAKLPKSRRPPAG
ncbi:MAG TPA: MmcQ/YjbR family DNA-binding protein, partial [Kribbellaceae bacterium]